MHQRFLYVGTAAVALLAACQASKPAASQATPPPGATGPAIETLGAYPVPANEFAYVYRKNNAAAADYGTRASVSEYLDLYTNFRLKVLEAEKKGLDTTQAFKRELDGYRQQLAQPYLTEKSVTDQLVREAYERMGQEINASHILVRVGPDATPADTLAAFQKISKIRAQLQSGADFGLLAGEVSEDPSAKQNGGKLGYFTAMQMVYPFETAAYKTAPGQLSAPVRTRFGYHVIKVNDRRAAQGEIKVAHLMVRLTPNAPKADSLTAKKKADELYARLKKGENWEKLVAQFSEDAGSAANGGELPPFGTGRMIPSFEETAFKMQKAGDIAPPVQTPYGWHIIKLLEKQPIAKFAEAEPGLKSKVAKDSRSELNKAAFLKRIRQEDQFVEVAPVKAYALGRGDTALVAGRFKYTAPAKGTKSKGISDNSTLFTIKSKPFFVKDLLAYAQQNQRARPGTTPAFALQQLYDQYVDQSLTDFEKNSLDAKYEDYRMLVKEYRDGILLFQLMDEKVWSKAIEDTVGLKKFFLANQDKYQWEPRVQGRVVSASSAATLAKAQKSLSNSPFEVTRNTPRVIEYRLGTISLAKTGFLNLTDLGTRLNEDTTATVLLTGRIKKGEKPALARARADSAAKFLQRRSSIAARRIRTAANPTPNAALGGVAPTFYTTQLSVLESELNAQNPLAVQITEKVFLKGDNKVVDELAVKGPGTYTVQKDGRFFAITITKNLPAGPKALADARGQATSDYQTFLEKEWITSMRTANPMKINEAEVSKLVTK